MSQSGSFGNANGLLPVNTLTGNSGGPVGPDGTGTINTIGSSPITVVGNPGTNTLTAQIVAPITVPFGGTGQTTLTAHSLLVGEGASAITSLGAASNGQIPIGSTGNDPVLATLTAGTGITVTNGAGSIIITASGASTFAVTSVNHAASPYTVLVTDDFLAVDVSGGVVTIQLPNGPAKGRVWYIKDTKGMAFTNNITVTTVGGVVTIDGVTSYTMNTNLSAIGVIFDGANYEIF